MFYHSTESLPRAGSYNAASRHLQHLRLIRVIRVIRVIWTNRVKSVFLGISSTFGSSFNFQ
jgi:hypothetical protein